MNNNKKSKSNNVQNIGAGIADEKVRKNKQKIHGGGKDKSDDNEIENTEQKGFEKSNLD